MIYSILIPILSKNREKMKILTEKNEGIKAAYDELVSLENDDERRQIYRIREKAIMDYKVQNRAAREEGREEGKRAERLEIVMELLRKGLDLEVISEVTKFPIEEIKKLRDSMVQ